MKKMISAGLLALMAGSASAEDVTLQLKWVTQAQFAGYYVAKDKGFFEEEGLNVTIKPGGPDIAPEQVIASGQADVITTFPPTNVATANGATGSITSSGAPGGGIVLIRAGTLVVSAASTINAYGSARTTRTPLCPPMRPAVAAAGAR